jgi:hypothetical protein
METTPDAANTDIPKKKTSVSETGHAKNVANFLLLGAYVKGFGPRYNPTKKVLEYPNLLLIHSAAKDAVKNVIVAKTPYEIVVNKRADEFADVPEYATQLINALESSDASERTIEDAKAYLRKIRGERATKKKVAKEGEPAPITHSVSQTSFDQTIQHMEGIASILKNEPSYAPNEEELTLASVEEKIERLNSTNDAVATVEESISNARLHRDNVLYNNPDALTKVAPGVKKYTKSVFKAKSPEFKQISGIAFRVYKKD